MWDMNSNFEKGKQAWVELQSETARLRVEVDMETGEIGVQSGKFKIRDSNTFLVLQASEPLVGPRIIPLGWFYLPRSNEHAASVRLLRAHPELITRMNAEGRAAEREKKGADGWKSRSRTWPCTEKRLDVLHENTLLIWAAAPGSATATASRILPSTYKLPCCGTYSTCD